MATSPDGWTLVAAKANPSHAARGWLDNRFGRDHPKSAEARRELAGCLTERGDYAAAETLLAEARKALSGNKKADSFAIRRLASLREKLPSAVYPGQVSGNYAVWGKITRRAQTVYLYDIAAGRTVSLDDPLIFRAGFE